MQYSKTYLIDDLLRFTDMFDTLLIITLFLLASLLVCLLTLRLSINIKYLFLFFHSLPVLTGVNTIRHLIISEFNAFNKRLN